MSKPWSTVNECSRILYVAMTRVVECDKRTLDTGRTGPRCSRQNAGGFISPLVNPQNNLMRWMCLQMRKTWGLNNPGRVALKTLYFSNSNTPTNIHYTIFLSVEIKTSGGERIYIWEITAFQKKPVCESWHWHLLGAKLLWHLDSYCWKQAVPTYIMYQRAGADWIRWHQVMRM